MYLKIGKHWINTDKITHIKGDMEEVDGQPTEEDIVIVYFGQASLELRGEEAEEFLSNLISRPELNRWKL